MRDTVISTITKEDIQKAEELARERDKGLDDLERFFGTIETYGGYLNEKPDYSNRGVNNEDARIHALFRLFSNK